MDPKATQNGSEPNKVMNPTQASKTLGQQFGERLREDAAAQKAISDWARRSRGESTAQDDEQARRDLLAGVHPMQRPSGEPVDDLSNDEPASDEESSDAPSDEVNDSTPEVEDVDPFSNHRVSRPIRLEVPANIHHIDENAVADLGHVGVREGWTPEFAQGLVNTYIMSAPKDENLDDPERTVSALRWDFGDETDTILHEVAAFVAKRPALSSWLDASGVGNSPTAIKLLAAAAREPALLTKAGAQKFIAGLKENKKYAAGDKMEIAKARLAFTVAG